MAPKLQQAKAPKLKQAKAIKRPATSATSSRVSQPRGIKSARLGVIKKPAAAERAKCPRPRAVLKAVNQCEGIPKQLHDALMKIISGGVHADRMQTIVAALQEHLQEGEDRLLANLRDAQSTVDELADDKNARTKSVHDAETELAKVTQALADGKLAIRSSGKNVNAVLKSLDDAKLAQRACEAELQTLRSKRELLQNTAVNAYGPLKEAAAGGAKAQKQLNILTKVGKDFGFHEVLVGALPAILRKQPDKRRTFDGLAMTHLEAEFEKQKANLVSAIQNEEASLAERSTAVRVAHDSVANAKEQQQSSAHAVEEISNSLSRAKEMFIRSRTHAKNYARDAFEAERALKSAKSKLISFRKGPLAALGELQMSLTPAESECAAETCIAPRDGAVAVAEMTPESSLASSVDTLPVAS